MLGQSFSLPGQASVSQGTRLCHLLSDEALLRRLCGNIVTEDCVSALRTLNLPDSFWTDEFKVVPCAKTFSHKWTLCPCAHIGETARRRCPRSVNYKAVLCPLVKAKKTCPLGDSCGYAHNVFEHWLHPSRYKTRLCSFGRNCNRTICFFAHSAEELRCVPCADDKDGDDREYLMQLVMAQESGLLPPSALEPVPPPAAPMPPALLPNPNLMTDLGSMIQQTLQQPLPPSARSSINGMPPEAAAAAAAAAAVMSGRPSMNGVDLLPSGPTSMSELPKDAVAANVVMYRASMPGLWDAPNRAAMLRGRPSMNGLPDRVANAAAFVQPGRASMNGLPDARTRPSLSGLPENSAVTAAAATNMLLSISLQQHHQQYHGSAMQRAASSELNSALHAATSMQRAMSSELGAAGTAAMATHMGLGGMSASYNGAAAAAVMQHHGAGLSPSPHSGPLQAVAAAAAMERAFSRELPSGSIPISPVQPANGVASAYQAAAMHKHQREMELVVLGGGPSGSSGPGPQERMNLSRRDLSSLAHVQSMNSIELDSLLHADGGPGSGGGMIGVIGSAVIGVDGPDACGALGVNALGDDPQAPARLSDPGSSFPGAMSAGGMGAGYRGLAAHVRASDWGNKGANMLVGKDLHGLETLLPLVNNALASGALSGVDVGGSDGAMRRSNSGSNSLGSNGRGQSPPLLLQEHAFASPSHSGSLTSLSSNSPGENSSSMDGPALAAAMATSSSPGVHTSGGAATAFNEYMAAAAAAAAAAAGGGLHTGAANLSTHSMMAFGGGGGGGSVVDQSYLNGLVARLQDQGVNKDQLVSSLSQLLAQLLSVQ